MSHGKNETNFHLLKIKYFFLLRKSEKDCLKKIVF